MTKDKGSRTSNNAIRRSHELRGDSALLADFYQSWAMTYNSDVLAEQYSGPEVVARIASGLYDSGLLTPRDRLEVLDAGCGTGLVGTELRNHGFTIVDGFDLSHAMVAHARRSGAYRDLHSGLDMNLKIDMDRMSGMYDLTICCGVYTTGHVTDESVELLIGTVRRGGYLIISTRTSYLAESSFSAQIDRLTSGKVVELFERSDKRRYIDGEDATYWTLRVP